MKAILDAEILEHPFRHLFAERVFDEELFKGMEENLPEGKEWTAHSLGNRAYVPLIGSGFERLSQGRKEFWKEVASLLCSQSQVTAFLDKFGIKKRCVLKPSLVRLRPGYSLGPHTDEPSKVLTLLFYIRGDRESGTVIYKPKRAGFTCRGEAHHKFGDFEKVKTVPFIPNSVFAFQKSSVSFHGVEPVKSTRDVIQYNINEHL